MRDFRPSSPPEPAFPIRLVALDVDGTLVGEDFRIRDRIRAAIAEAVRRGVRVSLATGRMATSAMGFAADLGLVEPLVAHQGAVVREMPRRGWRCPAPGSGDTEGSAPTGHARPPRVGRLVHHQPLPADVVRDAVRWCYAHGLDPHVHDLERIVAWERDPSFDDYSGYLSAAAAVVPDLEAAIDRPMTKVISVGLPPRPMELLAEAREAFAGRAEATVSHPRFLEFVAPGVSKGRAVAWLAHRAGIPLGQVMTIGDALNDLEMIESAGHGVAMATAPDVVRGAARYVAPSVDEDGAALMIETLVLADPPLAVANARRLVADAAGARVATT